MKNCEELKKFFKLISFAKRNILTEEFTVQEINFPHDR